jgi:hypothetical protein
MDKRVAIGLVCSMHYPELCHRSHSKAMLPTEVEHKYFYVQQYSEEQPNNSRVDDLTKLEELREVAAIQSVKHQQAMRRYHARNIISPSFQVGDFIL